MIGNQEGARQEFETARELRGDTVNVGYEGIVARFHLLNDELDDARSHFEKCVRVGRPEKTIQYCSIGLVLLKWRGGHDSLLTAFALGTTWPRPLLDFVRGKDNEEALARTILAMPDASARRTALCEALYYAGEGALQHGDKPQALRYFRASVSMRVESFWENLAAQRRIEQLHGNDDPKPPPPPASHIPIS
jgi:hypothetical protein